LNKPAILSTIAVLGIVAATIVFNFFAYSTVAWLQIPIFGECLKPAKELVCSGIPLDDFYLFGFYAVVGVTGFAALVRWAMRLSKASSAA
jgi:hypothetical protein